MLSLLDCHNSGKHDDVWIVYFGNRHPMTPPLPHSYNYHLHIHIQLQPLHAQTTTTQCKLLECKCSIFTSGWKKNHHQRKLQSVIAPRVQVEYIFARVAEWKSTTSASCTGWNHPVCKWNVCAKGQGARCKAQDQHNTSWSGMQQHQATPTTDQLRLSTGVVGVHNAVIIAACVRAHHFLPRALPLHKLQWLLHCKDSNPACTNGLHARDWNEVRRADMHGYYSWEIGNALI